MDDQNPQTTATLVIESEKDIVLARKVVRNVCCEIGFGLTDVTRIVTAASELARNIHRYADKGVMKWQKLEQGHKKGVELRFEDQGPGIADITAALGEGFTTARSMGMGLPGTKRLMDEMEIDSQPGVGTTVTIRKWLR